MYYNKTMKRDATLVLRLPVEVKTALQEAADADAGRSMSGMAVKILSEWLTEHDHLAEPSKPASPKRGHR